MIFSALFSFLGGTAFRMIWGELSSWLNKKQDHLHEIERIRLQEQIDEKQHARNQEAIRVQAELGIKTIQVQADNVLSQIDAEGFYEGVKLTGIITGVRWIDGWNASIRPAVASWAIIMMSFAEFGAFFLSDNAWAVASAALGLYLADRTLAKRGK